MNAHRPPPPISDIVYARELEDGRILHVCVMLFNKARLCIGPAGEQFYDDVWCYPDLASGVRAASTWDGEGDAPDGWVRHPASGRRRPAGDPAKEYIAA